MYDFLGPVLINEILFSINLMSVHNSANFQQCNVIFAKSAVQKSTYFPLPRAFFADTVCFEYLAIRTLFIMKLSKIYIYW